ncbi:hypothetical protein BDY19DRAFT_903607 [Irpex rosettiformis]|uniref:Uncharacterized protein n=1 Tax=Irpex rosettiformis TaxID=378272 RepID=A0ACB8UF24_9APHY|nr:hypothetical protein BDY19DRAFT_903607 [Irpex rosettiformis]
MFSNQEVSSSTHISTTSTPKTQLDSFANAPVVFISSAESETYSFSSTIEDTSYYSPPPSGTRLSSISRFSTPKMVRESGTPSLANLSLSSTVSSPSLALTPTQYNATRNPDISNIGLGLSGLFLHDRSAFESTGDPPKQTELADTGFFVDETDLDGSGAWFEQDSFVYPEQVEDAWRKRIPLSSEPSSADMLRGLGERLPDGSSKTGVDQESGLESPTLPAADDVFYSHGPMMSSTPRKSEDKESRGWRDSVSHAMVSNWRKSVHLEEQETRRMAGFY